MKNDLGNFRRTSFPKGSPSNNSPAFTITELLVVIAAIALLTATLLPALANTKFRDRFASCTANLRQWGVVANAFSTDNKGILPSFTMVVAYVGGNLWDVDASMATNLVPYGLKVPMWFCPVRDDFRAIVNANPGVTITNPVQFIALNNPPGRQGIQYNHEYLTLFYSVYIPRQIQPNGGWWPINTLNRTPPAQVSNWPHPPFPASENPAIPYAYTGNPWPLHTSDKWAESNPIMTDTLFNGRFGSPATSWSQIPVSAQAGGHPYGGQILNANLLYADGHVVTHTANQFIWTWFNPAQYQNFY